MKKAIKMVAIIAGVLVIVGIIGGVFFWQNKDAIIRSQSENLLGSLLQVDVKIGAVETHVGDQTITVKNILIPNPEGYESDHAVKVGKVVVNADVMSFFGQGEPTIQLIEVEDSDINLEQYVGRSNLKELADRVSSDAAEPDPDAKPIVIDKFHLKQASVTFHAPQAQIRNVKASVSDIEITDLGKKTPAMLVAQIANELVEEIIKGTLKQTSGVIPDSVEKPLAKSVGALEGGATAVTDTATSAAKNLGDRVQKTTEKAGNTVKDVTEGIKGILSPNEKKN